MANDPDKIDEHSETDLADELEHIADHPKAFTKAEMAAMMREAAEAIRALRDLVDDYEAIGLANAKPEGNA